MPHLGSRETEGEGRGEEEVRLRQEMIADLSNYNATKCEVPNDVTCNDMYQPTFDKVLLVYTLNTEMYLYEIDECHAFDSHKAWLRYATQWCSHASSSHPAPPPLRRQQISGRVNPHPLLPHRLANQKP